MKEPAKDIIYLDPHDESVAGLARYYKQTEQARQYFHNPWVFELAGFYNFHSLLEHFRPLLPPTLANTADIDAPHMITTVDVVDLIDEVVGGPNYNPHTGSTMKPMQRKGFASQVANLNLVRRLEDIRQLSWTITYPSHNPHTRFQHSVAVARNSTSVLQSLLETNPEKLTEVLKKDFAQASITPPDTSSEQIIEQATRLNVLIGLLHDAGTVAGGEWMKGLLKQTGQSYQEEQLLEDVLLNDCDRYPDQPFQRYREELADLFSDLGFSARHVRYILDCIQGKSDSLLGKLINPPSRGKLDIDRLSYTLTDLLASRVLSPDLPYYSCPSISSTTAQDRLITHLKYHIDVVLEDPDIVGDFGQKPVFPWNTIDPTDGNLSLSNEGDVVFDFGQSDKLLALVLARAVNTIHYYCGWKMQGMEQEIQDTLVNCLSDQEKANILTPQFLLGCSDSELTNRLGNLDKGGRLDEMLRKLDSCGFYNHYRGNYSPTPSSGKGDIVRFKKELDLGLSTPIRLESGQVISLSSYIENLDPFNPLRSFLTTQLEKYTWEDESSQRYYYLILKPSSYPQPTRAFINL